MKSEQTRISRMLSVAETRMASLDTSHEHVLVNLERVLDLAEDWGTSYAGATDVVRRSMNQAIFERICVEDDGVRAVLAEPFRTLLGEASAVAEEPAVGLAEMADDVLRGRARSRTKNLHSDSAVQV